MSGHKSSNVVTCANCGKGEEGAIDLKFCTACRMVKYCNRDCQITHRPQHKNSCKKRAAELHDEDLFKEPPPEECPICCLQLPPDRDQTCVKLCCGKHICMGCSHAMMKEAYRKGKRKEELFICAFCRAPLSPSEEEDLRRAKKLMANDKSGGFSALARYYIEGSHGLLQDRAKANELLLKAGELGCGDAYNNLANSYYNGLGVELDKKKAKHFYEHAAMKGHVSARYNLGIFDMQAGNAERATKHFIIAARTGHKESLNSVQRGFTSGFVTKKDYENTLRAYQKRIDETRSAARDEASSIGGN